MGRELKAKEVKIDNNVYKIVPLKYRDAMRLAKKIGEIIAPALIEQEGNDISRILEAFFNKLDIDELCDIVEKCLSESLCNGGIIKDFDDLFAGNLEHLIKVAVEVVKINIGNFSLENILPSVKEIINQT